MPSDIFISHSSSDSAVAQKVCTLLEQAGFHCWFSSRDITPGRSWAPSIARALEESSVMVLILSVRASRSEHVRHELNVAEAKKIPVIAFRIEEVQLDGAFLYFLGSRHWLDARNGDFRSHITALIAAIFKVRGEKDAGISSNQEASKYSSRMTLLIWSAVLASLILCAVAFYHLLPVRPGDQDDSKRRNLAQKLVREGEMFEGRGQLPDAMRRYRRAEEMGDPTAAERLGKLFRRGAEGIPKDDQLADEYTARSRGEHSVGDRLPQLSPEPSGTNIEKQPALDVAPPPPVDATAQLSSEAAPRHPLPATPNPPLPPATPTREPERPRKWVSDGHSSISEMQLTEGERLSEATLTRTSLPLVNNKIRLQREPNGWAQGSVPLNYTCKRGLLWRKPIQCVATSQIQLRRKSSTQIEMLLKPPADMSSKCKSCEALMTQQIIFHPK